MFWKIFGPTAGVPPPEPPLIVAMIYTFRNANQNRFPVLAIDPIATLVGISDWADTEPLIRFISVPKTAEAVERIPCADGPVPPEPTYK
jgi:hypothetical protein